MRPERSSRIMLHARSCVNRGNRIYCLPRTSGKRTHSDSCAGDILLLSLISVNKLKILYTVYKKVPGFDCVPSEVLYILRQMLVGKYFIPDGIVREVFIITEDILCILLIEYNTWFKEDTCCAVNTIRGQQQTRTTVFGWRSDSVYSIQYWRLKLVSFVDETTNV